MLLDWLGFRKKKVSPEYWVEYVAEFESPYGLDTLIEEVSFVVFDTETTWLDVKTDRLLSIGAVKLLHSQIEVQDAFECFIRQDHSLAGRAVEVHGILPVDREGSIEESRAVEEFFKYIGRSVLVGHHIPFDAAMINRALRRQGGRKMLNKMIDTGALALRLDSPRNFSTPGEMSLDNLCKRYGIPLSDRHTAAGDAFITAILFLKLTARLRSRGVQTLGDLLR
jgi:DNA polymerase III subunit epsilon